MKPIIIFCREDGDKITLTKEELEKICQDAYDQGFEVGKANSKAETIAYPTVTPSYPDFNKTTPYYPNRYEITCSAKMDGGNDERRRETEEEARSNV